MSQRWEAEKSNLFSFLLKMLVGEENKSQRSRFKSVAA